MQHRTPSFQTPKLMLCIINKLGQCLVNIVSKSEEKIKVINFFIIVTRVQNKIRAFSLNLTAFFLKADF